MIEFDAKRRSFQQGPRARLSFARWTATLGAMLSLLVCLVGCRGGVSHPEPGEPNTQKYCADRTDSENNCMACSSQPGCGWCDSPQSEQSHCQPGTTANAPGTCLEGWALSTEDCAEPPPPPPPAPPAPPAPIPDEAPAGGTEGDASAQTSSEE